MDLCRVGPFIFSGDPNLFFWGGDPRKYIYKKGRSAEGGGVGLGGWSLRGLGTDHVFSGPLRRHEEEKNASNGTTHDTQTNLAIWRLNEPTGRIQWQKEEKIFGLFHYFNLCDNIGINNLKTLTCTVRPSLTQTGKVKCFNIILVNRK